MYFGQELVNCMNACNWQQLFLSFDTCMYVLLHGIVLLLVFLYIF